VTISAIVPMTGSYDHLQVALSVLMAVSASYAALDLAGRVTATSGWVRSVWLTGGATAMGLGIWSMHFVGMLAFRLPVPIGYDWPTVLASFLVGIWCSAFALYVASRQKMGPLQALVGGLILGVGIAALQYLGMAAMRLAAVCRFNPLLATLSVALAILFSVAALLLAFDLREETKGTPSRKIASAAVMGAAISAMHYTGMASASFIPSTATPDLSHAVSVSVLGSAGIVAVTLIILGVAVLTSAVSRRFGNQALEGQALNDGLERRVLERTGQLTAINHALAESEERFRKLVEALPDAIFVVCEERVVFVNPSGVRLLGAQRSEQIVGKDLSEIIHPGSLASIRRRIRDSYQTGVAAPPMEHVLIALDGSSLEVESAAIPILWKGSPAIEAIALDIRERKRAERTVQEWQTRLELAQKAGLRIGLWDWDMVANTVVWSDETYRQWGFIRDTFSGRVEDALPRIHPKDQFAVEKAIQTVRAGGSEFAAHYRIVWPDGTTCWIDAHGVVIRGGSTHMIGIGIDITDQKKSEQSLQEAKMELARVARIVAMGELTASIAHEINQPLAAVATNASASLHWLAVEPPSLAEAREAMASAMQEANRASRVIERIRTLLKKASPELQPLDGNEVIREVLLLAESELLRGGVTVKTELAADVPTVLGDRVQLQQVMLNLIMNGIDAMSTIVDRPRELVIRSAEHPDGVLIQVQDSGTGLDPEQADRIFEPFFTTKPQGIGVGLSISHSIIEAHGGRLWVTPGALHGAVFQFTLPKADTSDERAA
jgi:PAS domain S-box-containing protein